MTTEEELALVKQGREYCWKELTYYRALWLIADSIGRSHVFEWERKFQEKAKEAGVWPSVP